MRINYIIAFLLILLSILLTILVPGGPIETRDFSSYSPFVLTLFNIFLTSLGILSFLGAYLVIKNKAYSLIISAFFAICYIAVYISDLFKIFPVSPIPMPQTLFIIEVVSTILGFVLLYICIKYNNFESKKKENITLKLSFYKIISLLVVLLFAIGIVIFATKSAMGQ
ncbi:hypothetical protein LXN10_14345 [Arcobacter sp. KX21116]|uniref:hypothetical protein n=1 Tax=Arcobacter iocasae TaxID=2906515 RepID=UPI0035D4DEAF